MFAFFPDGEVNAGRGGSHRVAKRAILVFFVVIAVSLRWEAFDGKPGRTKECLKQKDKADWFVRDLRTLPEVAKFTYEDTDSATTPRAS